jgi:hypothetical protein
MRNPYFGIGIHVKIILPYDAPYNRKIGKIRKAFKKKYSNFVYSVEIEPILFNGREVTIIIVDERYLRFA